MQKRSIMLMIVLIILLEIIAPCPAQAPLQYVKPHTRLTAKQYAKQQLEFRGYPLKNWVCLKNLWTKESHWNHKANNKHSTAYGIGQLLNEKSKDYVVQINNGLRYIEHRYGNPCNAWKFWQKRYWY